MKRIEKIAAEVWKLIRYLATGHTRSRKDRRALADYGRYRDRERSAEAEGRR